MAEEIKKTEQFDLKNVAPSDKNANAPLLSKLLGLSPGLSPQGKETNPEVNGKASSGMNGEGNLKVVEMAKSSGANNGKGNAFTKLFGKSGEKALDVSSAATLSAPAPSLSQLLGAKPDIKSFEEAEARRTKLAKIFFSISLIAAFAIYEFFYSQLNASFTFFSDFLGQNVANRFENSNAELEAKQTNLNSYRYRTANLWLAQTSEKIDAFDRALSIKKSDSSTNAAKNAAETELISLENEIKEDLKNFQRVLNSPLGIDTYSLNPVSPQEQEDRYWSLLRESLMNERAVASAEEKPNREAIRMIDNILRLVENRPFWDSVRLRDFGKMDRTELSDFLSQIRDSGTDELSLIGKIRSKRLNWGRVIQDIHAVIARRADTHYGQGYFQIVGGFLFNSYRFDSKTGRITLTGLTKRSDTKLFSTITELVDSIEKSRNFKDIDFRSFAKTRDENGDYSSSINVDFSLQTGSDPRDEELESLQTPIQAQTDAQTDGQVSRIEENESQTEASESQTGTNTPST